MALLSKFLIERDIPGVGGWDRDARQAAAAKSNAALRQLGPDIQLIESAIAGHKTFCVYLATDEALLRKHSQPAESTVPWLSWAWLAALARPT